MGFDIIEINLVVVVVVVVSNMKNERHFNTGISKTN